MLNLDESLLNCYDMDIPEDELTFIVIDPPKHGRMIYLGGNTLDTTESIDSFTCMQLKAGLRSFCNNFKNIKNSNGTYRAEDSPKSKLQIQLICSFGVLNNLEVIGKRVSKNRRMLNPV